MERVKKKRRGKAKVEFGGSGNKSISNFSKNESRRTCVCVCARTCVCVCDLRLSCEQVFAISQGAGLLIMVGMRTRRGGRR